MNFFHFWNSFPEIKLNLVNSQGEIEIKKLLLWKPSRRGQQSWGDCEVQVSGNKGSLRAGARRTRPLDASARDLAPTAWGSPTACSQSSTNRPPGTRRVSCRSQSGRARASTTRESLPPLGGRAGESGRPFHLFFLAVLGTLGLLHMMSHSSLVSSNPYLFNSGVPHSYSTLTTQQHRHGR